MEKLLICGDSFAADWTKKYPGIGWPNLLTQEFDVTNLAQAGCSEYKIWLQIESIIDQLDQFKYIIISHTSPYRIYVKKHPVHFNDLLHCNSDLIYTDIKDKKNPELDVVIQWFERYFDLDYAVFVYNMLCQKIDQETVEHRQKILHITHCDTNGSYQFENFMSFENVFRNHRGVMNHYNDKGNQLVAQKIKAALLNLNIEENMPKI